MTEHVFMTTHEDPELEALEIVWAAIAKLDFKTQRRIAMTTLRRASDEMRKADKEYNDFCRLKVKFEPAIIEDEDSPASARGETDSSDGAS